VYEFLTESRSKPWTKEERFMIQDHFKGIINPFIKQQKNSYIKYDNFPMLNQFHNYCICFGGG